ncbi:Methyltransferase type 11 [Sergentomyia squamirostris]
MSFSDVNSYYNTVKFTTNVINSTLNNFLNWIQWRYDGKDSLLDIGTGPGNSLKEVIYPRLPSNFTKLVCSDISPGMVELQKTEFQGYPKVSCEILDISADISDDLAEKFGTYDHVTSFACLMWVSDQQKAMDNIFKLLKPGGDAFLVIVTDSPILQCLTPICEDPRWKDYFKWWQDFYVFPYINLQKANAEAKGLKFMKTAGFVELKYETLTLPLIFHSDAEKESFLRSMPNMFSKHATPGEEEEIFQTRLRTLNNLLGSSTASDSSSSWLMLYGKKPAF